MTDLLIEETAEVARIRTIKPEFFTSLTVVSLELTARLTFIGLWTHCDDDGRCVDEPRLIKAALWPLDDRTAADVEADLCALHKVGLIVRYEVAGRRYLAVTGWKEHQRINRPSTSKIPPPPDGGGPHGGLSEPSVSPHSEGGGGGSEPSCQPEMSDSGGAGAAATDSAPTSGNEPIVTPPTSTNALTESSVSPHGTLTEDSLQERKGKERNREQGKESDARAREADAPPSAEAPLASLAPPPVPASLVIDRDSLAAHIADELSVRTGLDVTPAHCTWVADDMLTRMPPRHDPALWVRGQIRVAEDIRQFLTPDLAAAYTARARRPAVVSAEPESRRKPVPLPDDFTVTDAMRRWANREAPAGIDLDHETAQFISHYRARGTKCVSWPDEWQKWIRGARPRPQAATTALAVGGMPAGNPNSPAARRLAGALDTIAWAAEQDRLEALQKGQRT